MPEDILLEVRKPARYIGHEWNASGKDFDKADTRFALSFPDLYEIGMSNLGLRIIYDILNNIEGVCCERIFSVQADMEKLIRQGRRRLLSLESQKELSSFDIIGFSLGYELSYTNVLNILDLGGIPIEASLRNHSHPLVIGGGPCVMNPEPLSEFFDLFVIGEAEGVIPEIIDAYRRYKDEFRKGKLSRQELLARFCRIEGLYAPSLYDVSYDEEGKIAEFKPKQGYDVPAVIRKRFVSDLEQVAYPVNWLVPNVEIVHDRIILEVMRGCPNTCRFCQARAQYFPFRVKSPEKIIDLACSIYRRTGYEDMSLMGLSVSDYPHIENLLEKLVAIFKEKAVSVSLPSVKPKTMVGNLSSLIASIKKTGLTFAPEAATDRLRKIIGKDFDRENFILTLEKAYASGYQHIKLYFLIGLPTEEDADLDGIINLAQEASGLRRKAGSPPAQVNISVNALIPKPHTPFQWLGMENIERIKYKQDYLKARAKNRRLKLSFHNRYMSILEGVFSRGDRRLSKVILCAFRKGARFDAWENNFNFSLWEAAFKECGIDYGFYLRQRPTDEILPWDFLDVGIDKKHLISELSEAITYGS